MQYNPGTALGSRWLNHFFLVEFVGLPARSHIWAFKLKPKGASFELDEETDVVSGILPTGIKFGPDGALYVADWINGWNTKNYGRVWKLDVSPDQNDLQEKREETKRLIQLDYAEQSEEELLVLLSYSDMRVRQKAQFALSKRGKSGWKSFTQAIEQRDNQRARIHGIWGIGQLAAGDAAMAEPLVPLLSDGDREVVSQAAKVLGDIRYPAAAEALLPLLESDYPRAVFYGAQALGRLGYKPAAGALIEVIKRNNDEDNYIRHAAVLALSRIGTEAEMVEMVNNSDRSLRIAAVLVLRRLGSDKVQQFLKDEDEYIVTEAARAINDDLSIETALPALAAVLSEKRFTSEPLLRRSISACLRVGGESEMDRVMAFAQWTDVSPALRAEALATLGVWPSPSTLDRVDGRLRGKVDRDPSVVTAKVKSIAPTLLLSKDADILVATGKMLGDLNIADQNETLARIMRHHDSPAVRSAMLSTLHTLHYSNIESVIKQGMNDKDENVRTTAVSLLGELDITAENLPGIVTPIFTIGSIREQQQLLRVLGEMPTEKSSGVLSGLVDRLAEGQMQESDGKSELKMIMGGRYLQDNTTGTFGNMAFEGMGITGYDVIKETYCGTWVDNFSTAVMQYELTWDPATKTMSGTNEVPDMMTGKYVQSRSVEKMISNDHWISQCFQAGPDGKEMKTFEIEYTRAK
jgi:HEAT repeat protein